MNVIENNLIGGLILSPEKIWEVADILSQHDLEDANHAQVFREILRAAKAGEKCDALTLAEAIPELSSLIMDAATNTLSSRNVRLYAERVAQKAISHRVKMAGIRISSLGPDASLADAFAELQGIDLNAGNTLLTTKDILRDVVDDLQAKCESESLLTGLDTGFDGINAMTAGLQPSDLVIIAGRPSSGKSTLAQNIAENVALGGKRVLFFTLEMSAQAMMKRCMASIGRVNLSSLRSPKLMDDADWGRVLDASSKLSEAPLVFDETSNVSADQVCARSRQAHSQDPLSLIVIDYLSYMAMPNHDNLAESIQDVTRQLKGLAKALNVPIILLSQLNRGVENRADKRPLMSDLRSSGAIEQDADLIIFMYRDEYYHKGSPHKGFAEAIIAKQRNGETGTVPLRALLQFTRFEDAPDGLPHTEPVRKTKGFSSKPSF